MNTVEILPSWRGCWVAWSRNRRYGFRAHWGVASPPPQPPPLRASVRAACARDADAIVAASFVAHAVAVDPAVASAAVASGVVAFAVDVDVAAASVVVVAAGNALIALSPSAVRATRGAFPSWPNAAADDAVAAAAFASPPQCSSVSAVQIREGPTWVVGCWQREAGSCRVRESGVLQNWPWLTFAVEGIVAWG